MRGSHHGTKLRKRIDRFPAFGSAQGLTVFQAGNKGVRRCRPGPERRQVHDNGRRGFQHLFRRELGGRPKCGPNQVGKKEWSVNRANVRPSEERRRVKGFFLLYGMYDARKEEKHALWPGGPANLGAGGTRRLNSTVTPRPSLKKAIPASVANGDLRLLISKSVSKVLS